MLLDDARLLCADNSCERYGATAALEMEQGAIRVRTFVHSLNSCAATYDGVPALLLPSCSKTVNLVATSWLAAGQLSKPHTSSILWDFRL